MQLRHLALLTLVLVTGCTTPEATKTRTPISIDTPKSVVIASLGKPNATSDDHGWEKLTYGNSTIFVVQHLVVGWNSDGSLPIIYKGKNLTGIPSVVRENRVLDRQWHEYSKVPPPEPSRLLGVEKLKESTQVVDESRQYVGSNIVIVDPEEGTPGNERFAPDVPKTPTPKLTAQNKKQQVANNPTPNLWP